MCRIDLQKPSHVFFIGIGGISMSGLAKILLHNHFTVSGSDMKESDILTDLRQSGIEVFVPQDGSGLSRDLDYIVYTAAIHPDNPEFIKAKSLHIPMISRADLLGQIMDSYARSIAVSGTHGKTTTTSMLSQILLEGQTDPTISIGGFLDAIHSNVRTGNSDIFITEACEYTNSFLSFYPKYNVILNIEAEHLDFFKDLSDVRKSFIRFAKNTQPDGTLFLCEDIADIDEIKASATSPVMTFGLHKENDCYPNALSFQNGCAVFAPIIEGEEKDTVCLAVPGEHNVKNALAAICVAYKLGLPFAQIKAGLEHFGGANRRFQKKGTFKNITVIDDYAHHPTEIKATLKAARNFTPSHLAVVFQPHTYTRTKALFAEFVDALSLADTIVLADIYAARETDTLGMSSDLLCRALKDKGKEAYYFSSFDEIESFFQKKYMHDGMLITMGAGNVYLIGEALVNA